MMLFLDKWRSPTTRLTYLNYGTYRAFQNQKIEDVSLFTNDGSLVFSILWKNDFFASLFKNPFKRDPADDIPNPFQGGVSFGCP